MGGLCLRNWKFDPRGVEDNSDCIFTSKYPRLSHNFADLILHDKESMIGAREQV